MKKTFKKVLLGLGISLMLFSCGVVKKQQERNDYPLGASMKITCNIENGKFHQIDSIIVTDTLPPLNKWLRSVYLDYETGKRYMKYMYIKRYDEQKEVVYLVFGNEEPFKITKRITE